MRWSISLLEAKTMTEGGKITAPHYALNINSFYEIYKYKYTYTNTRKYANTQIHKYTNTKTMMEKEKITAPHHYALKHQLILEIIIILIIMLNRIISARTNLMFHSQKIVIVVIIVIITGWHQYSQVPPLRQMEAHEHTCVSCYHEVNDYLHTFTYDTLLQPTPRNGTESDSTLHRGFLRKLKCFNRICIYKRMQRRRSLIMDHRARCLIQLVLSRS